jgi:hypothetical protein
VFVVSRWGRRRKNQDVEMKIRSFGSAGGSNDMLTSNSNLMSTRPQSSFAAMTPYLAGPVNPMMESPTKLSHRQAFGPLDSIGSLDGSPNDLQSFDKPNRIRSSPTLMRPIAQRGTQKFAMPESVSAYNPAAVNFPVATMTPALPVKAGAGTLNNMLAATPSAHLLRTAATLRTAHDRNVQREGFKGTLPSCSFNIDTYVSSSLDCICVGTTRRFSNTATIIGQQNVMALPAFMEMRAGTDFTIGKELARGGGGAVHMGETRHEEILRLTKTPQLVVKTIFEDLEDPKNTLISFEQEVSIMWLFQNEPNIAKV